MTVVALNPDGSSGVSPRTVVTGGASAHAVLSDASDSSYTNGWDYGGGYINNPGDFSLTFTTFTLPAGAVTKEVNTTMRMGTLPGANNTVPPPSTLAPPSYSLSRGSGYVATSGYYASTSTITNYVKTFTATNWSQADIDGITVDMNCPYIFNVDGAYGARIYKFSAALTYVTKPVTVVNAVTPDPIPTSNIAAISWSNTLDADGGAQTRYWVRVFTQAQYSIGGFDPETSPATYDSGNLTGAATSLNTTYLPGRNQTYRVYVRVGQTVNSVSHYSDWSFDQFSTAGSTALIPAGTRAPVTITGGQRAVITLPGGAKL
jgi:hypothetical protein